MPYIQVTYAVSPHHNPIDPLLLHQYRSLQLSHLHMCT